MPGVSMGSGVSATDTGSGAVSKAGDTLTGPLLEADGTAAAPSYSFSGGTNTGLYRITTHMMYTDAGANRFYWNAGTLQARSDGAYGFSSTTSPDGTADVLLTRDSSDTLAQRRGTTAQTTRMYNTWTNSSNGEWLETTWSGNLATIAPKANGTGTVRQMNLGNSTGNIGQIYVDYTNTGTVGAVTINKAAGRVNIAASGTSVVVTNSLVTAASHVMVVMSTADATGRVTSVVPAAGSFTINTVSVTAQASFDFFVINAD